MLSKQRICLATSILILAVMLSSCAPPPEPSQEPQQPPGLPDLVWTGTLTLDPSFPIIGEKLHIKQTWSNAGSAVISSDFDIRLEIRRGVSSVFDQHVRVQQPVEPGEERTIDIIPEYVIPRLGVYQITLTLDSKEVIAESGEDNNITQSDTLELRPRGNIILDAYDSDGNLLSYTDFRKVTHNDAYATDLNNLPYYGFLGSLPTDYSAQAIPAFFVVPQTPYRIHVLWEVPEFGKVILSADNEGKGYSVDRQRGKLTLDFNYEAAKSKLAMLQRDYNLLQSQGYSISNAVGEGLTLSKKHLELAEGYLTQTPSPDMKSAVAELNLSLKHSLWAHEQLHLDRAKADIDRYRKGSVKLKVVGAGGELLSDCNVSFQQTSHDFLFSANPVGKRYNFDPRRARLLREAGINYSYINPPWSIIEPSPGKFNWDNVDTYQDIQAQLDEGFKLMGAYALRLSHQIGFETYPKYLDNMSFEELEQHIYSYMYAIAKRYKGKIDTWEIYETNWANPFGLTWDQKLGICKTSAKAVTDANPEAKIAYASLALPYEWNRRMVEDTSTFVAEAISHLQFVSLVIERQIPIDIIGVELYYSGVLPKIAKVTPGLDLVAVSGMLDQYSAFGKPVFLREVSAPSVQVPGTCWWHRYWDEQTQAEYLEKLYTIAFGKPLLQEICWSYGVSDDEAFMTGGGLLDADSNPKQSFLALKNLIKSWTTTSTGVTNEKGEFELRGFAGDYNTTLVSSDGRSCKTKIHIFEQESTELTICIEENAECIVLPSNPE